MQSLGLDGERADERAKYFMKESASMTQQRDALKQRIDRLTEIKKKLLDFAA